MKLVNKTLALLLACSGLTAAQAGNFPWDTIIITSGSLNTQEVKPVVAQGIADANATLPDLPKPWFLRATVGLGDEATNYKDAPALIMLEKLRNMPNGKPQIACRTYWFGTSTRSGFLELLRQRTTLATSYVVQSEECVVNESAPESTPAKKSTKK